VPRFDLPRREPIDSLPPTEFSPSKDGDAEGSQEKEVLRGFIQSRVLREYVGKERLPVVRMFLEQFFREDVLNKVCDLKLDLISLLPKSEQKPSPAPGSSAKRKIIDLTTLLEDREESADTEGHEEDGNIENDRGSEEDRGSEYVDQVSDRHESAVEAEPAVEAELAVEAEGEDEALIKTMLLESDATSSKSEPTKRKTLVASRGPAKRRRQNL
jgi:hypothetical protein